MIIFCRLPLSTNRGVLASFSDYGLKTVHVEAVSETSMATPHVAGIAALLLAQFPLMTAADLKQRIIERARPLVTLSGRVVSGGLAGAYYALSGLTSPPDPNDPSKLPNQIPYSYAIPHNYKEGSKFDHTIKIPGAKKVSVRFTQFETEIGYDTVSFLDANGGFVSAMSGTYPNGTMSPLVDGDTISLKFTTDETINAYGFDVGRAR